MKIEGFRPHKGQQRVIDKIMNGDEKYITVVSPRQQGKSLLLINLILFYGINDKGCKIGIIAPIYQQARKLMEDLYEAIKDSGIVESTNFSNHEIKLRTGSKIYFRSSEREDGLRGYTFSYLFLDESSYQSESAWKRAIQPTALVHGKKVVLFSTPRGRDWFYQMYMLGEDAEYPTHAAVRMEQGDNPYINQEEVRAAKRVLPEAIYRAEYQGEFLEGESMVFQNFKTNSFSKYPNRTGKVYIGVDLGRESDYTVAVAMDQSGNVIEIYRDNQKDWSTMESGIIALARKYAATIMIETNSMGTVVFESIKKKYQDTHPFVTSSKSKNDIVESLILAFNDNQIAIPNEDLVPELHQELEVFEMSYNPKTRNVKYGARSPFHDDLVIALCIANWNRISNKSYGQYAVMGGR